MAKVTAKKKTSTEKKSAELTAKNFIEKLKSYQSDAELKKYQRYFRFTDAKPLKNDTFIGVRMGQVFSLAKSFIAMSPGEIEKLMENKIHEVRAGGMSIMGKQASHKKTSADRLKELYELYIRRHDRINSWDLVDLAAHHVVGRYLADKPRTILYKLARSKDPWEKRTAIVSTAHFIKNRDINDTYAIATEILYDDHEFVNTATGWMLRYAGTIDRRRLIEFLDAHAATMPRVTLRACLEHFHKKERDYYLNLKSATGSK